MNRLTVTCKTCGAKILALDALPALIDLVLDLLVKLATQMHGAFHPAGSQLQFEAKVEPILIETAHVALPPKNPKVN